MGQGGYRPLLLMLAALFFALIVLLPVPGSLISLVEQVNPPGYAMLEADTETIADSVNYRHDPEAFEAWRLIGGRPIRLQVWIPVNRLPGRP